MKQAINYLEIAIAYVVIALQRPCFDLSSAQVGFVFEKVTQVYLLGFALSDSDFTCPSHRCFLIFGIVVVKQQL
jgi:hypothetical protein